MPFVSMEMLLLPVARMAGMPGIIRRARAMAAWPEVVGPQLADKTEAIGIREDVLIVKVQDPAWAHELSYLKEDLIERLKRRMRGTPPKDIRFVTGSLTPKTGPKKFIPVDLSDIKVPKEEVQRRMDDQAKKSDPKLRKLLETLIADAYRLDKHRHGN